MLRLPLDGGSPELISASGSTTEAAAFAPDGTLWYSNDAGLAWCGRLAGAELQGADTCAQILADGHTALGADPGR